MDYGVIGVGPVGATFGGMLAASGKRVSFLDNNVHRAEVLKQKPLKIMGRYQGEVQLKNVYTDFHEFAKSEPDVILIAVKTHTLREVLNRIKGTSLETKAIVSCQNGIDTEKEIEEVLGEEHAFRIIINLGVSYSASHEISVNFVREPHYVAAISPKGRFIGEEIVRDMQKAGVKFEYTDNITRESFRKAILNSTLATICTLTRMTMSEAMSDSELLRMVRQMLVESLQICDGIGIDLGEGFVDKSIEYLKMGGNHKPSMLIDIEKERQTEIRHLAGKLYEYATQKDVLTPVTQSIFYLVKSLEKSVMVQKYVNIPHE